jgi:hypothetical protein
MENWNVERMEYRNLFITLIIPVYRPEDTILICQRLWTNLTIGQSQMPKSGIKE